MKLSQLNYKNVEIALEENGFVNTKKFFRKKLYSPDSGNYLRYFAPSYSRKHGGYQITGNIGIEITGSEVEKFLDSVGEEDKCIYFDLLTSNFRPLMYVPTFDDFYGADLDLWIRMICGEVNELPADINALANDIKHDSLGKHELWGFLALNENADAIKAWVISNYG
jgi:hypothetical protein